MILSIVARQLRLNATSSPLYVFRGSYARFPCHHVYWNWVRQHRTVENDIPQSTTHTPAEQGENERLSRFLHEVLPSPEDTERICTASHHPSILSHEIMTMPYTTLDQKGLKTPVSLLEIPKPNLHPVLISRHMLLLASFLQHLRPDLHEEIKGLSESPRAMMERLADLAIGRVTTNDQILGSIEVLECVMIESVYQANIGSLRRSWVACRRAMSIAQLMGINRPALSLYAASTGSPTVSHCRLPRPYGRHDLATSPPRQPSF